MECKTKMAAGDSNVKSVSDLFDEGLDIYNGLNKNYEPTNSFPVQCLVKQAMHLLEDCTKLISLAGLFSTNEAIEEVPTAHIKFFLLPALLGTLSLKLCVSHRLEVVTTAETYFRDFLSRCKLYGIIDFDLPEKEPEADGTVATVSHSSPFDLSRMALQRNLKIQRFKEQKEMERQLAELQIGMDDINVDDDVKRNYYLTLIKSFSSQAIDELDCIVTEKEIVINRMKCEPKTDPDAETKSERPRMPPPNLHPHKPLMPVIITRNEAQKQVFGAGYPSLPVMTVQEFYDKRVQDGEFPDPSIPKPKALQDLAKEDIAAAQATKEETELEERVERDDPDLLQQRRNMDEYKDTHRRGWGNRANRS